MAELSLWSLNNKIINDVSNLQTQVNTKADNVVVSTSNHGLMSKEDKTKLNSLTKYNFSTTAPPGRSFGQSSTVGTSSTMARSDHAHAMPTTTEVFNAVKGHHGSGSGLDADLLDGKHASAFALEGHTHPTLYLSLSGGTVNGDITSSRLRVNGTTSTAGYLYSGSTAPSSTTNTLNFNGVFRATKVNNPVYKDIAETFKVEKGYNFENTINKIVTLNYNKLVVPANENSECVIGVVSDTYGFLLGDEKEVFNNKTIPVGLAGTVFIQADPLYYKEDIKLGSYVIPTNDGMGKCIDKKEYFTYFNIIVGKVIDVDIERKMYKILITIK